MMYLNTLKPQAGAKKARKRVGRGIGSGLGKTCGRGHKGQHSRAGGFHKVGFEGGQMPLQRRLPKFGFTSRTSRYNAEISLEKIKALGLDTVDMATLFSLDLIPYKIKAVKIIGKATLDKPITVNGLAVTASARAEIERVGGTVGA